MKRNPARPIADAASDKLLKQADELIKVIRKNIDAGMNPVIAVDRAWQEVGYTSYLEKTTIDGIINAMGIGLGVKVEATKELKQWLLSSYVNQDNIPLRQSIWGVASENKGIVIDELKAQMVKNASWTATAKGIADTGLAEGDVSGQMKDLIATARRAYGGDPGALATYRTKIEAAQRYVDTLAANGAPTERLKKAYQNIINATQKGTDEALDKALDRAVRAKARYNADRVARTEIARAYGDAVKDDALKDDDAVGIRSELSSRHDDVDVCDYYAEADMYGMGPGVYPKDETPPYPYHPHDMCALTPVYRGDVGEFDAGAGAEWVDALSKDDKLAVLGRDGYAAFQDDPSTWQDNLRGYNAPEKTEQVFPDNILMSSEPD